MMASKRHSSILLSSLLGLSFLATATAQLTIGIPGLFEVNLTLPEEFEDIFEGDGDNSTDGFDFESIFNDLSDFIGESLDNFTLPTELEDLFDLPTFENFSFSFGGNCSICDSEADFDGSKKLDGIACRDWAAVSTLGILDASEQCDLLRVGAAQSCGCPVPELYATKTCQLCPEGQVPSELQASSETVLAVTCASLENAPAVDGDRTCDLISRFTPQCDCEPSDESSGSTTENTASSSENTISGATQMMPMALVAVGAVLSAAHSML